MNSASEYRPLLFALKTMRIHRRQHLTFLSSAFPQYLFLQQHNCSEYYLPHPHSPTLQSNRFISSYSSPKIYSYIGRHIVVGDIVSSCHSGGLNLSTINAIPASSRETITCLKQFLKDTLLNFQAHSYLHYIVNGLYVQAFRFRLTCASSLHLSFQPF